MSSARILPATCPKRPKYQGGAKALPFFVYNPNPRIRIHNVNTIDQHVDRWGNTIWVGFSGLEPKKLWCHSYRAVAHWLSVIEARVTGGKLYEPEDTDPE